jgi:5-methylcytosine-specific restriction protein B
MSQLVNIYNYLITNRKHLRQSWRNEYEGIVKRIASLRTNLNSNTSYDLNSLQIYNTNTFKDKEDLFWRLFANTGNGVSSNGRSIFSGNNRSNVIDDPRFLLALKKLIVDPSFKNHNDFEIIWNQKLGQNNPVLTNRTTAACTIDVSSTVDSGKFNKVFNWLIQKNLIAYSGGNTWYEKNKFVVAEMRKVLSNEKHYDEFWCNIFYWEMYENLANPFNLKKQLVKYGAPGTGKTYEAKEVSKLQFDIWKAEHKTNTETYDSVHKIVQFHPSYSYEDFMEGLRPVLDVNNQAQLQLVNGIFKTMCIAAGKWEVDFAQLTNTGKLNKKWEQLTINDLLPFKDELTKPHWAYIFNTTDKSIKLTEAIPPYFIIIDEINRAELSRVFGELMYCLEYRGVHGAIETQYNQLNTAKTGMIALGESYKFFVPHNLYVIGTMNTVDRSVESFDFALRRRFRWEEVKPSIELLRYHLQGNNPAWVGLADNLKKLNEAIIKEPLLGKDFCIGHAYLMDLGYASNTTITEVRKLIWEDSILSLLEEYVRGTGRENEILETFAKSFGV